MSGDHKKQTRAHTLLSLAVPLMVQEASATSIKPSTDGHCKPRVPSSGDHLSRLSLPDSCTASGLTSSLYSRPPASDRRVSQLTRRATTHAPQDRHRIREEDTSVHLWSHKGAWHAVTKAGNTPSLIKSPQLTLMGEERTSARGSQWSRVPASRLLLQPPSPAPSMSRGRVPEVASGTTT